MHHEYGGKWIFHRLLKTNAGCSSVLRLVQHLKSIRFYRLLTEYETLHECYWDQVYMGCTCQLGSGDDFQVVWQQRLAKMPIGPTLACGYVYSMKYNWKYD